MQDYVSKSDKKPLKIIMFKIHIQKQWIQGLMIEMEARKGWEILGRGYCREIEKSGHIQRVL